MAVTGHLSRAMFDRYKDLFSKEELEERQRQAQQKRSAWKAGQRKAQPVAPTLLTHVQ